MSCQPAIPRGQHAISASSKAGKYSLKWKSEIEPIRAKGQIIKHRISAGFIALLVLIRVAKVAR